MVGVFEQKLRDHFSSKVIFLLPVIGHTLALNTVLQLWHLNERRSEDEGSAALLRRVWSMSGSSLHSAEGGHNGIILPSIFYLAVLEWISFLSCICVSSVDLGLNLWD